MARQSFVANLESLRGLAAATVCLFHAGDIRFHGASAGASPIAVLLDGLGAVVLFFVLSGYVLRRSLEPRRQTPWPALAAAFLTARGFRLYPTVIATVLLMAAVAALAGGHLYSPVEILRNAALLDTTINGVFWTLQVEVVGSALIVVAFLIERRFGLGPLLALAVFSLPLPFIGLSARDFGATPMGLLQAFLLGYLAAAMPRPKLAGPAATWGLLALGVGGFYAANVIGNPLFQWSHLLTEAAAVALVLVLSAEGFERALVWPPLRGLGVLSYSFYALHPLGLGVAGVVVGWLGGLDIPAWIGVAVAVLTSVAASIPIAAAMHFLVERPGIRLGRWTLSVWPRRAPAPA